MMEFLVEFTDEFGVDKIDKCIAHITLILSKRKRVPDSRLEDRKNRIFFWSSKSLFIAGSYLLYTY